MVGGKIHRARVTGADLNYIGSIGIDRDLLDASDIYAGQQVDVVNITNGNRLTTYVIEAERGSGMVQLNGAAAHLVSKDDIVIIIAYVSLPEPVARIHQPHVVFVDDNNKPKHLGHDLGSAPDSYRLP